MKAMRIAFLTPEYSFENSKEGGLGTYVHRMAKLLVEFGHETEVFIISHSASETIAYNGVQIHYVNWRRNHLILRGAIKLARVRTWQRVLEWFFQARALGAALERRHSIAPFDLVQSADYFAVGLLVRRRVGRLHVVRCSTAADLYNDFDQTSSGTELCRGYLERLAMRRADIAYAPSRYIAEHFKRVHNIDVNVLRPPNYLDIRNFSDPPISLPGRFFLHFGQLMERKGTDLLAKALPLAWREVPDLTMVWSGRFGRWWDERKLKLWQSLWEDRANQVHITGPLTRRDLYAVLQRADAAVLPSQVDNLPNTVIESLMLGIPVIGSRGASIDELVEEDRTGHLVALGDVDSLAEALTKMWLRRSPVRKGFAWNNDISKDMQPERAVGNLLALVR
jgi:glycosyltransferase involved in cell wall biosynthesis